MDFREQVQWVLDEIRGAWRFSWTAVAVVWAVAVFGWLAVWAMPDVFESRSRVYVDTSTALKPVVHDLVIDSGVRTQLDLVRQALLSRPQLANIASEVGLLDGSVTPTQRDQIIDTLNKAISVSNQSNQGEDQLYTMSYRDNDRARSLRVVEILLNTFVNDVLGGKREGQEVAQEFLRDQIKEYETRLSTAETRLAEFKKRNLGLMPGAGGDYFARLQGEQDTIEKTEAALRLAMRRQDQLRAQLNGESPYVASKLLEGEGKATDTAGRLNEAETKLQELLLRYTPKHPEVIALKETIVELQDRRTRELQAVRAGRLSDASGTAAESNPVYLRIQVALNEADVEIAALRGEIADRTAKVAQYRSTADNAAEVEAELSRLNRDYEITRQQYVALVDRLDKSMLGAKADEAGVVKFEVIEPPTTKAQPVAPNRTIFASAVLLVALLAGTGTAYVLHLTRPVFMSEGSLSAATGLPVLGSISAAWPERWREKEATKARRLAIAGGMLIVAFVAVLVVGDTVAQWLATVRST